MFDKIVAFPDGVIEYHYKDTIVIEGRDMLPIIKRKYDKDLYGTTTMDNIIRGNFSKPVPN